MKSVFTIYLCIFSLSLLVSISSARITIKEEISFYLNKFWTTSCHFSPPLSRTRRSVDLPNVNDPKELFDYLLPLANVKPEDFASSQSGSRSFSDYASSWVEDVVDLWQQECRRRHQNGNKQSVSILQRKKRKVKKTVKKRSTVRNQGIRQDDVITLENYPQNLTYVFAYSPITTTASPASFSELPSAEDEEGQIEEEEEQEEEQGADVDVDDDDTDDEEVDNEKYEKSKEMTTAKTEVEEHTKGSNGEGEDEETTTEAAPTTPAATVSRLSVIPADTGTEYFSSYGGDVEYFYPLIAFGIPFDGYITVLGFHGFSGIFTW